MTFLLYLEDPYVKSFQARVLMVDGDKVVLDRTAFYPGGGGQEPDVGTIDGMAVEGVLKDGEIYHLVPGHDLRPDDLVEGRIDWERRHDLMRGHTAEHLIFSEIKRRDADAEVVKISITPGRKSFVIRGEIVWEDIGRVQESVNAIIRGGIDVDHSWYEKGDPELEGVRSKIDRIAGENVRVVRIGDVDAAACAGIHVSNTREIGGVLITALNSARPEGDYEVVFEVGERSMETALFLAHTCLVACEAAGSHPEDLTSAIENLKARVSSTEAALRECSRRLLSSLSPEEYHGVSVYSGIFHSIDRREFMVAANDLASRGSACVLISVDGGLTMVAACHPDLGLDCRRVLNESLKAVGGKGGGKPHFATGGAPSGREAGTVLERALRMLRDELTSR